MSKKIKQWFKKLLALTLVVTMTVPQAAFAAEPTLSVAELAWLNMPEIEPYDFDTSGFLWDAGEPIIDLAYLNINNNDLAEFSPEVLEEMLRIYKEQNAQNQEYFLDEEALIQRHAQISALLNGGLGFSALTENDRVLIFWYLDISNTASDITTELFRIMERDGFSLYQSVEMVRIIATGLFDYIEAQMILESIPCSIERKEELERFERIAQRFDIADAVNEMRLVNTPFITMNRFDEKDKDGEIYDDIMIFSFDESFRNRIQFRDISVFLNANRSNIPYTFFGELHHDEIRLPDVPFLQPELVRPPADSGLNEEYQEEESDGQPYEPEYDNQYPEYEVDEQYPELESDERATEPELDEQDSESGHNEQSPEFPEENHALEPSEPIGYSAVLDIQSPVVWLSEQQHDLPITAPRFELLSASGSSTEFYVQPSSFGLFAQLQEPEAAEQSIIFSEFGEQLTVFDEQSSEIENSENYFDSKEQYLGDEEPQNPELEGLYPEDGNYNQSPESEEQYPEDEKQYPENEEQSPEHENEYPENEELYPEDDEDDIDGEEEEEYPQLINPQEPQCQRSGIRNARTDRVMQIRPWSVLNRIAQEDWMPDVFELENQEGVLSIFEAFTNERAFNVVRQMFLDGHSTIEINAAFALGAALQVEPQTFMIQSNYNMPMFETSDYNVLSEVHGDIFMSIDTEPLARLHTFGFDAELVIYATDANVDELDAIIAYGLAIMYFGFSPMSDTPTHGSIVSNPFELRLNLEESVCLNTGAAIFRTNVLSLPGRNGFGINLDLLYNSSQADLRRPTGQQVWDNWWGWQNVNSTAPRYDLHGLGVGWIFDLPHILDDVLHVPGRGRFVLNGNQFRDRTLQDMQLHNDTTFTSSTLRSTRRLAFHNGTSYFFHNEHVIGMVDRFGNTIRFEYANVAQFGNQRLLTRIVDTNGKAINLQYQVSGVNRIVTVTSPDNSTYVINMGQIPGHAGLFQINSIQNQVGTSTTFTYTVNQHFFDLFSKTPRTVNHTLLMTTANYPSGAQLHFQYVSFTSNLNESGSVQDLGFLQGR